MKTVRPLGLYIHIPFCKAKCVYCDFYSLPHGGPHGRLYRRPLRPFGRKSRRWPRLTQWIPYTSAAAPQLLRRKAPVQNFKGH